jgi:hypothetical protein
MCGGSRPANPGPRPATAAPNITTNAINNAHSDDIRFCLHIETRRISVIVGERSERPEQCGNVRDCEGGAQFIIRNRDSQRLSVNDIQGIPLVRDRLKVRLLSVSHLSQL